MKKFPKGEGGQAITEYILLVAVIGIVCLIMSKAAGVLISGFFTTIVNIFSIPIP
jgi:Flp pilus assembly pilin Flp